MGGRSVTPLAWLVWLWFGAVWCGWRAVPCRAVIIRCVQWNTRQLLAQSTGRVVAQESWMWMSMWCWCWCWCMQKWRDRGKKGRREAVPTSPATSFGTCTCTSLSDVTGPSRASCGACQRIRPGVTWNPRACGGRRWGGISWHWSPEVERENVDRQPAKPADLELA